MESVVHLYKNTAKHQLERFKLFNSFVPRVFSKLFLNTEWFPAKTQHFIIVTAYGIDLAKFAPLDQREYKNSESWNVCLLKSAIFFIVLDIPFYQHIELTIETFIIQ
jgi:hypothetical protein